MWVLHPGFLVTSQALLNENSNPPRNEIACAIEGNLCRCTGYQQIIDAIEAAAAMHRGDEPSLRPQKRSASRSAPSGSEEPTMPPGHAK